MEHKKTVVNSWNEWDPLKHVIVGRADGTCIPAPEPALDAKVPEDSDMRGQFGPRTKDAVDKAKLNLKHVQDMEKLKDQQKREKENMSEHKNILDAYKEMWENGVKYAPQIEENMERKIMSKMRKGKAPRGLPR